MPEKGIGEQWKMLVEAAESAPANLDHLTERLGLKLHRAYLDDEILGMIEKYGDTFRITLNAETTRLRQRFTLAHELGHYMFHRHLIGDGLDDAKGYRSTNAGKYHNINIGPEEEAEANQFAVNLLMPMEIVKREWARHGKKTDDATIQAVADKFDVSRGGMRIRLGLGSSSQNTAAK